MKREISTEEAADIVDRYRRGQGLDAICFATDRSRKTVRQVLVDAGVKIRRKGKHASGNWGWTGWMA